MGRGGHRQGAGRKSGWKNSETQTIRVPKIFADQILEYARQLDSGGVVSEVKNEPLQQVDSETISEAPNSLESAPGQISIFDVIDSVPESKRSCMRGIDLAARFGVNKGVPSQARGRFKSDPAKFLQWTKDYDPEGIGWEFDPVTKLYHPVEDSCDDF